MKRILALAILTAAVGAIDESCAGASSLIVHEWGTFTSYQDERGATISGINVDDEPVPKFVHRLDGLQIFSTRSSPSSWSQGSPRCHADVTLRLETPVLYFYPQDGFDRDQPFDVRATFVGGWLTEFFPWARAENPGFPKRLDANVQGSLRWTGIRLPVKAEGRLPETAEPVWLAPRQVGSALISKSEKNEAEKYLFYRGVGQLDAPLVARTEGDALTIELRDDGSLQQLPTLWIVHVSSDGRLAYRRVNGTKRRAVDVELPRVNDEAPSELDGLRAELKAALIAEGLYEDEAEAMLATWRLSYFESEGLRIFFSLPRDWIDARLPLSTSVPSAITRAMLGRIELVSLHQREVLKDLYGLPDSAFDFEPLYYESNEALNLMIRTGETRHAELYRKVGREVPLPLQLYDSLGRFRDALVVHERDSTSDPAKRARLKKIISKLSACIPDSHWTE